MLTGNHAMLRFLTVLASFVVLANSIHLQSTSLSSMRVQNCVRASVLRLRGGSQDHGSFTAERLSLFSRDEVQHIFRDVDVDGSDHITLEELDFLAPHFAEGGSWDSAEKKKIMRDLDTSGDGQISADEFYEWVVLNTKASMVDGAQTMQRRSSPLKKLSEKDIPEHLVAILDELGTGSVVQKVTHPLHSGFGRTLRDHFITTYLLLEQWGNPKDVKDAGLLHAIYQRGDGLQAVDFREMRPVFQEKLGVDVERLIYGFPSSHRSAVEPDGLLHAMPGTDITVTDVLTGEKMTITDADRAKFVELEVSNSHDQNRLENKNPVHNLWSFYQHATALPYMSIGAQETIRQFQRQSLGASCSDIVKWHEQRFSDAGKEVPENWQRHLAMFRPGGKYHDVEKKFLSEADTDGDGQIDWNELMDFMSSHFAGSVSKA